MGSQFRLLDDLSLYLICPLHHRPAESLFAGTPAPKEQLNPEHKNSTANGRHLSICYVLIMCFNPRIGVEAQ
jgi:hypothetical protein